MGLGVRLEGPSALAAPSPPPRLLLCAGSAAWRLAGRALGEQAGLGAGAAAAAAAAAACTTAAPTQAARPASQLLLCSSGRPSSVAFSSLAASILVAPTTGAPRALWAAAAMQPTRRPGLEAALAGPGPALLFSRAALRQHTSDAALSNSRQTARGQVRAAALTVLLAAVVRRASTTTACGSGWKRGSRAATAGGTSPKAARPRRRQRRCAKEERERATTVKVELLGVRKLVACAALSGLVYLAFGPVAALCFFIIFF